MQFIPNRKFETFKEIINQKVESKSIIKTDGHPSYPKAVEINNCLHIIVNHSRGFKNMDGHTTNSIEGMWVILKTKMMK